MCSLFKLLFLSPWISSIHVSFFIYFDVKEDEITPGIPQASHDFQV